MATSEGEAASFLEQLLSSIRIVKVFQASKPLVGVYDGHLEKVSLIDLSRRLIDSLPMLMDPRVSLLTFADPKGQPVHRLLKGSDLRWIVPCHLHLLRPCL